MKLLVIRLGALGDLLHVAPSLQAVKAAHPQAEIHFLTSPAYQPLLAMLPEVDQVWTYRKGSDSLWALGKQFKAEGIERVINLHPSFRTWWLTRLIAPQRSATYHKEKLSRKGEAQRRLTRLHAAEDFYRPFQRLLGLKAPLPGKPRLALPEAESLPGLPDKTPDFRWIGIIPGVGGKRSNRAWPPESYTALLSALLPEAEARNLQVFLIGGPDETALTAQLAAATPSPRLHDTAGKLALPQTASLLAQCDLVISGDTGPLHLAAAAGAPHIVALFAPTSLQRTGPLGLGAVIGLTPPESLPCWPCEQPACRHLGEGGSCTRDIPVTDVLAACRNALGL